MKFGWSHANQLLLSSSGVNQPSGGGSRAERMLKTEVGYLLEMFSIMVRRRTLRKKKDLHFERNIMSIFLPNKIEEVVRIFYEILRNKTQVLDGYIECVLKIRGRQ